MYLNDLRNCKEQNFSHVINFRYRRGWYDYQELKQDFFAQFYSIGTDLKESCKKIEKTPFVPYLTPQGHQENFLSDIILNDLRLWNNSYKKSYQGQIDINPEMSLKIVVKVKSEDTTE